MVSQSCFHEYGFFSTKFAACFGHPCFDLLKNDFLCENESTLKNAEKSIF
jgi:hypothetical protein